MTGSRAPARTACVPGNLGAALPALLLAVLLSSSSAGEGSFYSKGKMTWQDGQKATAAAKLVVVAKVIEAGNAKGKGWDGNMQRAADYRKWTGKVEIKQRVTVEVTATLRGSFKDKSKRLIVTLDEVSLNYRELTTYGQRHGRKAGQRGIAREIPGSHFALKKNLSYVLFLSSPSPGTDGKDGRKNPSQAIHLKSCAPSLATNATYLKSVRSFCAALRAWENPPKMSEEEAARIKKLIAQLGHEQYEKRQEADKALRTVATRIRPQLSKAAKGRDLESATAAERMLKDFCPTAGKTMYPGEPAAKTKQPEKPPKSTPSGSDPKSAK